MLRTLGIPALALVAGIGFGIVANDAGADTTVKTPAATVSASQTPTSCLLALESAWKTINPVVGDTADNRADFDAKYQECLQNS